MADIPQRIQLSRAKGWRMPANTVNVARPGIWGNPYQVWRNETAEGFEWLVTRVSCHWPVPNKAAGVTLAVEKYREFIVQELAKEIYPPHIVLHPLRGKNLACWCKPGTPCHADVLLELANAPIAAATPPQDQQEGASNG